MYLDTEGADGEEGDGEGAGIWEAGRSGGRAHFPREDCEGIARGICGREALGDVRWLFGYERRVLPAAGLASGSAHFPGVFALVGTVGRSLLGRAHFPRSGAGNEGFDKA